MNYKYSCDKCDYYTNHQTSWNRHVKTTMHIEGHRGTRSDKKEPTQCPHCDYKSKNSQLMRKHILNKHKSSQEREKEYTHYCKACDFGEFNNAMYQNHLKTNKHKQTTSTKNV